ncbi:thioredoxin family protein [Verrucomicrobium sp. BvORR034]|uniref:DUF899 domain-containing protein n=1 Tax=Verrucomicrobium sp. BvORR034 TaxID=1396418 RepID=UPI000679BE3C|nr:thioredoxin family protein [Verrucomicrobium sp. BvORR034]
MSTIATASRPQNLKDKHRIVSQGEWVTARKELLKKEKESTRLLDQLSEQRRNLPWVKITKNYVFDGPTGKVTLADLFVGRNQLAVYHFMFGTDWQEGCPSCSYVSDHNDAALPHLAARDATLVAISHAPFAKLEAFKKRMGWHFNWVSAYESDFNTDFHVSFTPEEQAKGKVYYNYTEQEFPSAEGPGLSVFYKDDAGDIYHTYSTYGRGLDQLLGTYRILDMMPKGRDEDDLPFAMDWVRYHDRYEASQQEFADSDKPYWPEVATGSTRATGCGCATPSQA